MSLKLDPKYQVMIGSSDNAPLAPGTWLEGVFVFENGTLVAEPSVN